MANDKKVEKSTKKVTFYLYDEEGRVHTKNKRIFSPYNTLTLWRTKQDDTYRNPKYVTFEWGVYETDDEEEIKFLDLYNNIWWTLEIKIDWEIIKKHFIWDKIHQVKRDVPSEKKKEVIIDREVEVQQIPKIVVESFTIEQLQTLCASWSINTTDCVKKEDYIKLLEESNKLS